MDIDRPFSSFSTAMHVSFDVADCGHQILAITRYFRWNLVRIWYTVIGHVNVIFRNSFLTFDLLDAMDFITVLAPKANPVKL